MLESYWLQFIDLAYYTSDFLYFFSDYCLFCPMNKGGYVMEIAGYLVIF